MVEDANQVRDVKRWKMAEKVEDEGVKDESLWWTTARRKLGSKEGSRVREKLGVFYV